MRKLTLTNAFAAGVLLLGACNGTVSTQEGTSTTSEPAKTTTTSTTTSTTTTVPTTTTTPPPDFTGVDFVAVARMTHGRCGEWYDLAISVGWPKEQWPIMSKVLYRESRCSTVSYYDKDPNGGSHGLLQINGFWCRPWRLSATGWLQEQGIVNSCNDLYNPEVNLRAGLAIWNYGQSKNGCGWRQAWATPCL